MRVAHEYQKKSAQVWMGCVDDSHRKQYLKNPKLNEELEDTDYTENNPDYFDFESTSMYSNANNVKSLLNNRLLIFLIKVMSIKWTMT